MAYLKIYCDNCGMEWEVYRRSMKNNESRICPHCQHEIDSQTWHNHIIPSLCMVHDANTELVKDHIQYHRPIFTISIHDDMYFKDRRGEGVQEWEKI